MKFVYSKDQSHAKTFETVDCTVRTSNGFAPAVIVNVGCEYYALTKATALALAKELSATAALLPDDPKETIYIVAYRSSTGFKRTVEGTNFVIDDKNFSLQTNVGTITRPRETLIAVSLA